MLKPIEEIALNPRQAVFVFQLCLVTESIFLGESGLREWEFKELYHQDLLKISPVFAQGVVPHESRTCTI